MGELLFGTHWDVDEARKSTVPILIVTGPYDMILAPEMMRLLDAELPTSRPWVRGPPARIATLE